MKYLLLLLTFTSLSFAQEPAPKSTPKEEPQFCRVLSRIPLDGKTLDFTRCETTEVTCYRLPPYSNCWAKPAPVAAPSPAPAPSPTPTIAVSPSPVPSPSPLPAEATQTTKK